ncbi:MAG: thiol-activated cytolysin family protein [Trueperaceae bacterium]|nr:thiol-activated cytolysin family protein [Trueperaceae bacterium]
MPQSTRSARPEALWRPLLALAALLALVACGGQAPGPVGSVDAFVAALPGWDEVAPPVVENAGEPTGEAPVVDQETVDGTVYTCSTTPYSIAKNPTEMALFNPIVDEPVGSTVREGINQLVVNALDSDVAVGAGASSFTSVESHSTSQTLLSLGLDARYLGVEASARLDYRKNASQRTYTAYFVQRLFTIAVDLPERPSSLFADGVTGADLQVLGISGSNLPLYIDSVSYGRILMFSFTSSDSRERIEAALEFSYDALVGGVDGFSETELRQTLSTARIEVFALGGPNTGVQNLIRDGSLASYFEAPLAINQVEPISFTVRNLGDNTLAKVGDTTRYDVRTCLPVGGGLPQPQHWWPADGDTGDAVGDVDLGELWGAYGAGWDGADPT